MKSGIGNREDPDPDLECICGPGYCKLTCEACADSPCVPEFLRKDAPSDKDKRRAKFERRRNGN